jgi:hypothetical protein
VKQLNLGRGKVADAARAKVDTVLSEIKVVSFSNADKILLILSRHCEI